MRGPVCFEVGFEEGQEGAGKNSGRIGGASYCGKSGLNSSVLQMDERILIIFKN